MKSTIEKNERYTIFSIKEKNLTSHNSSDLKSEIAILVAEGYNSILLNLSELEFMDSSGLGALLNADRTTKENNGFLVIYGLNENNGNLIRIAKLDKVLIIAPTQKEAIDLLILEELERDLSAEDI
ncbi:MAG: STAS domain-containing protein [Chitinophagales bacterium]|jgi:anti-sigma B factor antagonist|nr:STAS domain-containing protein [Sphingobacteriales bacterium]